MDQSCAVTERTTETTVAKQGRVRGWGDRLIIGAVWMGGDRSAGMDSAHASGHIGQLGDCRNNVRPRQELATVRQPRPPGCRMQAHKRSFIYSRVS